MRRGELYLVERAARNDTKKQRVFLVVSRQSLIDSSYSTVICAHVYTSYSDVNSQVELGTMEGLKHQSFARQIAGAEPSPARCARVGLMSQAYGLRTKLALKSATSALSVEAILTSHY